MSLEPESFPAPSPWLLLRAWLMVGLQSFGGGMATLSLIRRMTVDERRWLTEAEFTRFWSLVQLAPGINLLALTLLIGRKIAGIPGIFLALLGLLLPSVTLTILLTDGYADIQRNPWVLAALRGIIPAVVGLGVLTAWQIAHPLLRQSRRAGWESLTVSVLILCASALAAAWKHVPVVLILSVAGTLCGLRAFWRSRVRNLI